MHFVETEDVRKWYASTDNLAEFSRTIGSKRPDPEYLETMLRMPYHLQAATMHLLESSDDSDLSLDTFASIPFYSLCKGLFLPLSFMSPPRVAQLFGIQVDDPPDAAAKEAVILEFLEKDDGLSFTEKIGCVLGDAFEGRRSTMRRDSLLRLLLSEKLLSRRDCLDRLTRVGEIAALYAETRSSLRMDPPLTAAEVLRTIKLIPDMPRKTKFRVLRSLLTRCGKLEAFFFAQLLMRKAGFGADFQGPMLSRIIAKRFGAAEEQVAHAMALTDAFKVTQVLAEDGVEGLKQIQLQPLVPVRPTLAGGLADEIENFPVWVERKYDGIRLMLHKSTDARGSVLCGAYTRNRGDWLEQIPGLDVTIRHLPVGTAIVDGELYGTVLDLDRPRPATVYEVYSSLQGDVRLPVNLRYAAFDLIYLNGQDLTSQPLSQRRNVLSTVVSPLSGVQLPIPISLSEGQLANNKDDVNRLFHHFRAQGYEGIISKNLDAPYLLAARDPEWKKRKPEITLDLTLLGACYAVTTEENRGLFASYVIGARTNDGQFEDIGDVTGLDRVRDGEIQAEIMREGLMTGRRIERVSSSGTRPGVELKPAIVATVKFEGIARDHADGKLSLRSPRIVMIRSDKSAAESDTVDRIQEIWLRQRVG